MLVIPGHGPGGVALGTIWRGSWVGNCGLCPGVVQMVCQQQVHGTEVTSRLVLGESSVPFHPYACMLWTTWNHSKEFLCQVSTRSHCWNVPLWLMLALSSSQEFLHRYWQFCCWLGPGTMHACICPWPLLILGNTHIGTHQSCWWPGSDTVHVHTPPWLLCALRCSRVFPHWPPPGPTGGQRSVPHAQSPRVLWRAAFATPACRFMHPPCELGNFLALLMKARPVDNSRQEGGSIGSLAGMLGYGWGSGAD